MKIWENVNIKLEKHLETLFQVPPANKYHWSFALMLYLRYVNEFTVVRDLHEKEAVDTRTIINEMMHNFYDYIVAAELDENSFTEPPNVATEN